MTATHNDNLDFAFNLEPAPAERAGFGTVGILDDGTSFSSGPRYREITPSTDLTQFSNLTSTAESAIETAFEQPPRPSSVIVVGLDTSGSDTYTSALNEATDQQGADIYGVTTTSRSASDITSLATTVAGQNRIYGFQTSDADWLTSGVPAGFSGIETTTRAGGIYHPTDTEFADVAWLVSRLQFDPDVTSAPFTGPINGVAQYPDGISTTEKSALDDNNVNPILPFGAEPTYVDPGVATDGQPMFLWVTVDWFKARLEEDFQRLKLRLDSQGRKLTTPTPGPSQVESLVTARILDGQQGPSPHFVPGPRGETWTVDFPEQTGDTISGTATVQLANNATDIEATFNFQFSDLQ